MRAEERDVLAQESLGDLRVVVAVGSGFRPPSASFVVAPDGSFVGE